MDTRNTTPRYRAPSLLALIWMLAFKRMAAWPSAKRLLLGRSASHASFTAWRECTNTIEQQFVQYPAYTNYTAQSTTVLKGSSHDLSVKVPQATGFLTNNTAVGWINWNHDGDFDDVGETYALGTLNSGWSGAIGNTSASPEHRVPLTATSGNTRMRIRTRQGSAQRLRQHEQQ